MKKLFFIFMITALLLTGCADKIKLKDEYDVRRKLHISDSEYMPVVRAQSLATENAVIPFDTYIYNNNEAPYESGLLINNTDHSIVHAQNPHKRIYPASMTKIMTAIVIMDAINAGKISLDDWVKVKNDIEFNESNVLAFGLEKGDALTVNELMHGLLISSYNDCGIVLARYVAGSVNDFAVLMNEKAAMLGAANSHFVNPHGLHDSNHYTTPYDLYLIFKEFINHPLLLEIDAKPTYKLTYHRDDEKLIREIATTCAFVSSSVALPKGYRIGGWKTGTTEKAGSCIIFEFIKEDDGTKYICLVSKANDHDILYENVDKILKKLN